MVAQPVKVAEIAHSTRMVVDEQGAEAAAATEAEADAAADASEPTRTFVFRADRPFHMVLRESGTRTPLFMAHVAAPTG
jgi:serpin B